MSSTKKGFKIYKHPDVKDWCAKVDKLLSKFLKKGMSVRQATQKAMAIVNESEGLNG